MQELLDRIRKDGRGIGTEILKVDSFLNHQVDVDLARQMGEEFARLFADCGANKVLTVEVSGIPVAMATAQALGNLPLVFAKKSIPNTMGEGAFTAPVKSFTKGTLHDIRVDKAYLKEGDRILVLDDFLATGEAAIGLLELIRQAGAVCVGFGAVIEKEWQGGNRRLSDYGFPVHALATITAIHDGVVEMR